MDKDDTIKIDFEEVFAPVAWVETIRLLLVLEITTIDPSSKWTSNMHF